MTCRCEGREKARSAIDTGTRKRLPGDDGHPPMTEFQQVFGRQPAAEHVVAGHRWITAGMSADKQERHTPSG
jgi:hypothetical protein